MNHTVTLRANKHNNDCLFSGLQDESFKIIDTGAEIFLSPGSKFPVCTVSND